MSIILEKLKHIVTHIIEVLKWVVPEAKATGRPLAIKPSDALVYAVYQHQSTRATKISVYRDFKDRLRCSYKTFVCALNRAGLVALRILVILMRLNRDRAHLVKHTDATDIPVCLNKNAKSHRTMRGLAGWGYSGKGFYFGLKMTMTRDLGGKLLGLRFSPPTANDRDIFRSINRDIDGIIVADAGYVSKQLEKDMTTDRRILLIKPLKTMKKLMTAWQYHLYNTRFQIEFDFRSLKLFHGLQTSMTRSVNGTIGNYILAMLSFVLR